jgi:hypothetical protein
MKNPVPVGVFVADAALIKESDSYPFEPPVFGIVASSVRSENAVLYLEFLW